jgi:hypothetical protein
VLVHALTRDATEQAVDAGADGLTHLFLDQPHTGDLVARIASSGMHVVPTLSMLASLAGEPAGAALAADARVRDRLPQPWADSLRRTWNTLAPRHFQRALAALPPCTPPGCPSWWAPTRRTRARPALRTERACTGSCVCWSVPD